MKTKPSITIIKVGQAVSISCLWPEMLDLEDRDLIELSEVMLKVLRKE